MKLSTIVQELRLTPLVELHEQEVTDAYASDLLSDVVGHAHAGTLLITIQVHRNVVAVASLVGLSAVVIAQGRQPEEDVLAAARENQVNLLSAPSSAFTLAGRLYQLGLRAPGE
ncbi:MAG: DRTGG domain-containing protein [bacterium]|nr:DRTGG domain-containing protein [bacterium]